MSAITRRAYAWTGTPNASPSTMVVNGVVQRTNYAVNPSFEAGIAGVYSGPAFAVSGSVEQSHGGGRSLKITRGSGATSDAYAFFTLTGLTAGATYTASLWVFGGSGRYQIGINGVTSQWQGGDYWQRVAVTFVPGDTTVYIAEPAGGVATAGSFYLDDVLVETGDTAGAYFDGSSAPSATLGVDAIPLTTRLATASSVTVPLLMTTYSADRVAQNTVHEILGRSDPDVSFGSTQTRSGSFTVLYESIGLAAAARDLLAAPGAVVLTQSDVPDLSMQFVVTGPITLQPDSEDPSMWTLAVPFREVIA